jgi:hypothetical protein
VILEIISDGKPLRIPVSQLLVMDDNGTPICVAGEYGMEGAYKVSHAADDDFNQTLRAFGVGKHQVIVDHIKSLPVPGGARLLTGPGGM